MPKRSPGGSSRAAEKYHPLALSKGQEVVFLKRGNLVTTDTVNPTARVTIEKALTYEKLVYERGGRGRKTQMLPTEIECFGYIDDDYGKLPRRLLMTAGWLDKVQQALRDAGLHTRVIVKQPHPRPEVFQPQWDRLRGIELRWKQDEVLSTLMQHEFGRIECPTGYGKSWMIAALCQILPKARFHITTHAKDVIQQLYFDLSKKIMDVGLKTGDMRRNLSARVMCFSGKSLKHGAYQADILIVDECHEFATDDYMSEVQRYRSSRVWGFSASQNLRNDKADFELEGLFGPIRYTIRYQDAEANQVVVPIKVKWYDVVMSRNPAEGLTGTAKERKGIWRNRYRNQIIAKAAREFDDDEQVLIVVNTIEHAIFLKRELPEFQLCYSEEGMEAQDRAKFIRWKLIDKDEPVMTTQRRYAMKKAFSSGRLKKVIATGVWNRGVDFRNLSVVIRADAKGSAVADTQIPGRVARIADGKSTGIVVDFRDQFDSGFRQKASSRKRNYISRGWEQILPDPPSQRRAVL